MDEKSISDLLSHLIPDEIENQLGLSGKSVQEQNSILMVSLKAAGQSNNALDSEVNMFLNGEGTLLETTRTAVAKSGSSGVNDISDFLVQKFNLSSMAARLIATLLVRLFPAIGKPAGQGSTSKPKPRRKKKTSSSHKKPVASHKPKSSTRPASGSKSKKRKTSSKPVRRRRTRTKELTPM